MAIIVSDTFSERGKEDARRHREKQRDAVKKQLPDIIAQESIITRGGKGRVVRIPIKELQIPVFRHGSGKKGVNGGIGQGQGKPGDVLGKTPGKGNRPGQAGSEPGVDYIETEVEIEELIAMMIEDLGLPRLEEKTVREIIVELGYRIRGLQRTGPYVLLNKRRTSKEGMRRFWHLLRALESETGMSEIDCYRALKQAGGIQIDALALLRDGGVTDDSTEVLPFPILHSDDLRFHRLVRKVALHSRAVVFAIMDVSASMDTEKKYYARSMLFWLVAFLRKLYERVEIRFVTHHTEARLVPEEEFFSTAESGGTLCASAYSLVEGLIDAEYPQSQWNTYVWHSSDGDDFNSQSAVVGVRRLFERNINMFGYCEIKPGEGYSEVSDLMKTFTKSFGLRETKEGSVGVNISPHPEVPFLGVKLRQKEDLLPAIKAFLKQDRWVES